jgi:hypothetical protein
MEIALRFPSYDDDIFSAINSSLRHHLRFLLVFYRLYQAVCFADLTSFISCQSYGNSFPQSKQTTYVSEPSPCFLAVIGNVQLW